MTRLISTLHGIAQALGLKRLGLLVLVGIVGTSHALGVLVIVGTSLVLGVLVIVGTPPALGVLQVVTVGASPTLRVLVTVGASPNLAIPLEGTFIYCLVIIASSCIFTSTPLCKDVSGGGRGGTS